MRSTAVRYSLFLVFSLALLARGNTQEEDRKQLGRGGPA